MLHAPSTARSKESPVTVRYEYGVRRCDDDPLDPQVRVCTEGQARHVAALDDLVDAVFRMDLDDGKGFRYWQDLPPTPEQHLVQAMAKGLKQGAGPDVLVISLLRTLAVHVEQAFLSDEHEAARQAKGVLEDLAHRTEMWS